MKHYYEILEVDLHASQEVIEKAFKVLAKKYHPDTQEKEKKEWAEEQFKQLNEAYEILSDPDKRETYTKELEMQQNQKFNELLLKNADLEIQIEDLKQEIEQLKNCSIPQSTSSYEQVIRQTPIYQNPQNTYTSAQHVPPQNSSYSPHLQSHTFYRNHHRFKSILAFLLTLGILCIIGICIWYIPYTHDLVMELYQENVIIRLIVDFFVNRK